MALNLKFKAVKDLKSGGGSKYKVMLGIVHPFIRFLP